MTRAPNTAAFRANPFPNVTNLFCRIPLHYIVLFVRDCSPWRPDADSVRTNKSTVYSKLRFSRTWRITGNTANNGHALWARESLIAKQNVLPACCKPLTRRENPSPGSTRCHGAGTYYGYPRLNSLGAGILTCFPFAPGQHAIPPVLPHS